MEEDKTLPSIETALQALSLNTSDPGAIKTLAIGSKESEQVRKRLANPEALHTLIEVITCSLNDSPEILDLALRCLGNACADNDEARDTVTSIGFSWALQCLNAEDKNRKLVTTKVLYNICNDHEASQQKCYRERVHFALIEYCYNTQRVLREDEFDSAVDLLLWITGHKASLEPTLSEPLPSELLHHLLSLPCRCSTDADIDMFASLVESVLAFTRDEIVQKQIGSLRHLGLVFEILHASIVRTESAQGAEGDGAEDLEVLKPLETSLLWSLSDISAQAEGEDARYICNTFWPLSLGGIDQNRLDGICLAATCQVVGNALRTVEPKDWVHLEERWRIEPWLFVKILRTGTGPDASTVLHSAAGLLVNLTRAGPQVRQTMGSDENAMPALRYLCHHEVPQIKEQGVKLLRALGRDCPDNQVRFAELGREVMLNMQEQESNKDATMAEAAPS